MLAKQGAAGGGIGPKQLDAIVKMTEGYSGSDLTAVCQEAALCPIRDIGAAALRTVKAEDVRPITVEVILLHSFIFCIEYDAMTVLCQDFNQAVKVIRPSVSGDNLNTFKKWSDQFGISR
jgi:SpoVK/Ycf46/Vps4 family AAA+-type ATPase